MKTPEQILETAYHDGCELALERGFKQLLEIKKEGIFKDGYTLYNTQRERLTDVTRLTEAHWIMAPQFDVTEGGLRLTEDEFRICENYGSTLVQQAATFSTEEDQMAILLGKKFGKGMLVEGAPILNMGFFLNKPKQPIGWDARYIVSLPSITGRNAWFPELAPTKIYYNHQWFIQSTAHFRIPGMRLQEDSNWLLEDEGRIAFRTILEDGFFNLERYHRLLKAGRQNP